MGALNSKQSRRTGGCLPWFSFGRSPGSTLFQRLPMDLLQMVLGHLSPDDRKALRAACHETYELVNARVGSVSITQTGNAKLDVALGPLHLRYPQATNLILAAPLGNTELATLLTTNRPLLARLQKLAFSSAWKGSFSWQNLAAVCRRCPSLLALSLPTETMRSAANDLLAELGLLPSLQQLCLDSSKDLKDEHLVELHGFSSLKMLELKSCEAITDAGLQHLSTLPRLSDLRLHNLPGVSGAGLAACASASLTSLDISHCLHLTEAGMQAAWKLPGLTSFLACHTNLTGDALTGLSSLQALRLLKLDGVQLTPGLVAAVASLPRLQQLSLKNAHRGESADLEPLQSLRTLEVLEAVGYLSNPRELAALATLPVLTSLELTSRQPPPPKEETTAGFWRLRKLVLHESFTWHDEDLGSLVSLMACPGSLQHVELRGIACITDGGMYWMCRLPGLTSLSLVGLERVTDTGVMHLCTLSALQQLTLQTSDYVSMLAVKSFARMPSLRQLTLRNCWAISMLSIEHFQRDLRDGHLAISYEIDKDY